MELTAEGAFCFLRTEKREQGERPEIPFYNSLVLESGKRERGRGEGNAIAACSSTRSTDSTRTPYTVRLQQKASAASVGPRLDASHFLRREQKGIATGLPPTSSSSACTTGRLLPSRPFSVSLAFFPFERRHLQLANCSGRHNSNFAVDC